MTVQLVLPSTLQQNLCVCLFCMLNHCVAFVFLFDQAQKKALVIQLALTIVEGKQLRRSYRSVNSTCFHSTQSKNLFVPVDDKQEKLE